VGYIHEKAIEYFTFSHPEEDGKKYIDDSIIFFYKGKTYYYMNLSH
jgi:hypothetical protein